MTSASDRPTPNDFAHAGWDAIRPHFEELATRPLNTAKANAWLVDWSALEEALSEATELAHLACAGDTADPAKEAAHLRFAVEIEPRRQEQHVRLAGRLLDLGYERADLTTTIRRFRNQRDLFRAENIPVQEREQETRARYQKLTGGMTATWGGEELPVPRLAPFLLDQDRDVRERAFRAQVAPYLARREAIDDLFDQQYAIRQKLARNAGFRDYRDHVFRERNRFDYTPADCETFHDAVAATVVPAARRRLEQRRRFLGVETVRPWDAGHDPLDRPPLRPFETVVEFEERTQAVLEQTDPGFGALFATLRREGLLDLDSRPGKAPGGYCTSLAVRRRPAIFMSATGVHDNVRTLLHEMGHAVHSVEAFAQPLSFQWEADAEMNEMAAMAMELFASPHLSRDSGGYYAPADARRARIEHLDAMLTRLAWVATIDAFQHWLYASGEGHHRAARHAAWVRIHDRFDPGLDWRGLDDERLARWHRQLHIFLFPFYYVEYGLAQLAALQVWRGAPRDQAEAIRAYRRALALGGTRPLPELLAAAGARLAFDAATIGELVALIEAQLTELEAEST